MLPAMTKEKLLESAKTKKLLRPSDFADVVRTYRESLV